MHMQRSLSIFMLALTLATSAQTFVQAAQAKGGGGGHSAGGSHAGYSHFFGRGRGGRGRGYGNYNQGPTDDQLQAVNFQKRASENPYANVPQHVNVSNYIKTY
ncbi:MAG: hypothetical protein KGS72_01205 [Cyanobacteria bacterium REEB67]|nr:hypothetical protein [Cyanobacteria bacterium REEB67]